MAFGVSLKINQRSLQDTLNKLKKLQNDLAKEIDMELGAAAEDMATLAKQKAPGFISNGIYARKESFLRWSVNSNYKYSAYIEFGTGRFFKDYEGKLTTEWKQIAQQFYVNGLGRTPQHPFLYPSVTQVKPKLYKRLNNLIRPNK
jgi:anaerobic selenocysteine-containing dehydrogenase